MSSPCILIIDDDLRLRRLLRRYLNENGFRTAEAPSADEARPLLDLIAFDLIIMDVMMPGTNGYDMLKQLKEAGNSTPVLMLTAMGDIDNRIQGLEAGADDYLPKPFEPKELILRINNILKRTTQPSKLATALFGSCVFDMKTGALTRDGEAVALTGLEADLLRFLVERANQAVSRTDLRTLMDTDNDRTVDVQVTRLRKKIEVDSTRPLCIQTVRGQGYMLVTK